MNFLSLFLIAAFFIYFLGILTSYKNKKISV